MKHQNDVFVKFAHSFFLCGFSFTNILDSQDSRGRGGRQNNVYDLIDVVLVFL